MRQYFIILILLFSVNALGALSTGGVVEIRQSATAGNVNGGCFFPDGAGAGTDYSQQDAAEDSGTDLASVDATTTCTVTSATRNFGAADNRNCIHITAGTNWTAGWYEIISTAGNAAVLDRACGTAASVSGGTWYEGGAMSLNSTLDDDLFEIMGLVGGWTYWIKYGATPYVMGESINIANAAAGSALKNNWIIGYHTTRGDEPTGDNRPYFLQPTGTFSFTPNQWWNSRNLRITGQGTSAWRVSTNGKAFNIRAENRRLVAAGTAMDIFGNYAYVQNVEAISYRGNAFAGAGIITIESSWGHDSVNCLSLGSTSVVTVRNSIFSGCVTNQATFTAPPTGTLDITNNLFYGAEAKLGVGLNFLTNIGNIIFRNNILYGLVNGVVAADTGTGSYIDQNNNYFNNTTDVSAGWIKNTFNTTGAASIAVNPNFKNVSQVGGSGCTTAATNRLLCTGETFITKGVVVGSLIHLVSGTGTVNGVYYSVSAVTSEEEITMGETLTANATADKVWSMNKWVDFQPDYSMSNRGGPSAFPGGIGTSYIDIGPFQLRRGLPRGRK